MAKDEPTHGHCTLCQGPIPKGVNWTLTGMMNRVHTDPDDCIAILRPSLYEQFMEANPKYKSRHRYIIGGLRERHTNLCSS